MPSLIANPIIADLLSRKTFLRSKKRGGTFRVPRIGAQSIARRAERSSSKRKRSP